MAIPTDFKGFTPAAGTTKTFKLLGSATVGMWVCDVDGTLSATSYVIPIAPNCVLFFDQAYTDAQLIAVVKDWTARMSGHMNGSGPGGQNIETTKQIAVTATTTA